MRLDIQRNNLQLSQKHKDVSINLGKTVYHCSPGGNDTYIAIGFGDDRSQYHCWNRSLLSKFPALEQGGFLESVENKCAVGRFQMAGGEFCGNGARSFLALVALDFIGERELAGVLNFNTIQWDGDCLRIPFMISGCDQILTGQVKVPAQTKGQCWVELQMLLPENGVEIRRVTFLFGGAMVPAIIVKLPGITHIVTDKYNLDSCDKEQILTRLIEEFRLTEDLAVGLILTEKLSSQIQIEATVYVTETGTIYEESSCGSGTLAAAVADMSKSGEHKFIAPVLQPSGTFLLASIVGRMSETNLIPTCFMLAGDVKIIGELDVTML